MSESITTGEIARSFGVTINTVGTWIDSGQLVGYRVPGSKHRRVSQANLAAFIKANGMPSLAKRPCVVAVGVSAYLCESLQSCGLVCVLVSNAFDCGIAVASHRPAVVVIDASVGRDRAISLGRSVCGIACVISLASEDDVAAEELDGIVLRKPVDALTMCRVAMYAAGELKPNKRAMG